MSTGPPPRQHVNQRAEGSDGRQAGAIACLVLAHATIDTALPKMGEGDSKVQDPTRPWGSSLEVRLNLLQVHNFYSSSVVGSHSVTE